MKAFNILIILTCGLFFSNANAQSDLQNIIKVNYTSDGVSDFLVGVLKGQMSDPTELSSMISLMEEYRIHTSFYQDTRTNESVFVLDSISEVPGMSISGYAYYVHRDRDGKLTGKEVFMDKDFNFIGSNEEINWEITNQQKEISGYKCTKATMKDDADTYVWFTTEIPVGGGPYVYFGLPGMVLESNSSFESTSVNSVGYTTMEEFNSMVNSVHHNEEIGDQISLEEVFAKKDNFKRMVAGN